MPTGIITTVDGGYATIDFVDPTKKGPALAALIAAGGPGIVETITRKGPRRLYRVPVGNATAANLVDATPPHAVITAGPDSGTAAALAAADAAAKITGATTRPDMPTSANKYVGTTTAAQERALAPIPKQYPGDVAGGFGGLNASQTPTHEEVIAAVKAKGQALGGAHRFQVTAEDGQESVDGHGNARHAPGPGARANLGMSEQVSTEEFPPGVTPVGGGGHVGVYDEFYPVVQDFTATRGSQATVDDAVAELGEQPPADPEPSESWKRPDLNAYAASHGVPDAASLPNKGAVLEAIAQAKEVDGNAGT